MVFLARKFKLDLKKLSDRRAANCKYKLLSHLKDWNQWIEKPIKLSRHKSCMHFLKQTTTHGSLSSIMNYGGINFHLSLYFACFFAVPGLCVPDLTANAYLIMNLWLSLSYCQYTLYHLPWKIYHFHFLGTYFSEWLLTIW